MILMISYDLNGGEPASSYEDVKEMIQFYADEWKKPLYSQWFVETDDTIDEWHERMRAITDSDDHWFICRIGPDRQGWLPKPFWVWLRERPN